MPKMLDSRIRPHPHTFWRQSRSGGTNQRHWFDNDGYADGDAARIGTAVAQTDSEFGRHCPAPEGERGNQIQKPLLRRKVCGA